MAISERKEKILQAVVDSYIVSCEPISSAEIKENYLPNLSSATIRNELSALEEMGYLAQPHTSAGRVPSELGYRYYVDALVRQYADTRSEIDEINQALRYKLTEMDQILSEVSRLASSFTDYTGIAFKPGVGKVRIVQFKSVLLSQKDFLLVMTFEGDIVKTKTIHLGFPLSEDTLRRFTEALNIYLVNLPSDSITMPTIMKLEAIMGSAGAMVHPVVKAIYETMNELDTADVKLEGITKLLQYPEYSDISDFRNLMGMFEEKEKFLNVISSKADDKNDIQVYIGTEDESDAMRNTAMIFKNVTIGGKQFAIGVIGPKRMNYSKVIEMLNGLASGIDKVFGEGSLPPGRDDYDY